MPLQTQHDLDPELDVLFLSIHHILNALGEKSDFSAGWRSQNRENAAYMYMSIFLFRDR